MTVVAETFVCRGSSNLAEVSYDPDVENLDVTFLDGSTYTYFNVPPETYRGLTLAPSAGGFFARQIKGRFGYEQKD